MSGDGDIIDTMFGWMLELFSRLISLIFNGIGKLFKFIFKSIGRALKKDSDFDI